jgi:hypothetical protein
MQCQWYFPLQTTSVLKEEKKNKIFWAFLTEVDAECRGLIYCPELGDRVEEKHFYVFLPFGQG